MTSFFERILLLYVAAEKRCPTQLIADRPISPRSYKKTCRVFQSFSHTSIKVSMVKSLIGHIMPQNVAYASKLQISEHLDLRNVETKFTLVKWLQVSSAPLEAFFCVHSIERVLKRH